MNPEFGMKCANYCEREAKKEGVSPVAYAISRVMGVLWELNAPAERGPSREGLINSIAESYIMLTVLGPEFELSSEEMGKYISSQLGSDADSMPRAEFVERCYQVCEQAGDDLGSVVTPHLIAFFQYANQYYHFQENKEGITKAMGDVYISLMALIAYNNVDYYELEAAIEKKLS